LKFSVTGLVGPVQSAKVRLFVTDGSPSGGSIFAVSNNLAGSTTAWTEQNLNWSNAPPISGNPLSTLGSVANGTWVEFDVAAAITGNGTYSFAIRNASTNSLYFSSAEGANAPELRVETGTAGGLSITSFSPASGPVGTEVIVNGVGFSTVSAVRFNGTAAASFVIDSDVRLRAVVPTGATAGPIRIDTPASNTVSGNNFQVTTSPLPPHRSRSFRSPTRMSNRRVHRRTMATRISYGSAPAIRSIAVI
jgi:hypothetical protein